MGWHRFTKRILGEDGKRIEELLLTKYIYWALVAYYLEYPNVIFKGLNPTNFFYYFWFKVGDKDRMKLMKGSGLFWEKANRNLND